MRTRKDRADISRYLGERGILLAKLTIVLDQAGDPMRIDNNGVLWSAGRSGAVFLTKDLAKTAIRRSVEFGKRNGFNWSKRQYRAIELRLHLPIQS